MGIYYISYVYMMSKSEIRGEICKSLASRWYWKLQESLKIILAEQ